MDDGSGQQAGRNPKRVLKGFLSMTAASFVVMAIQLGYAAVTSRAMGPSAFGAYAVALSGIGLLAMVGGSSLGMSAARSAHDSESVDRTLVTTATLTGILVAGLAILLAPLWGRIWGAPESVAVTQVLALSLPVSAASAVIAGILRRMGRTHVVAVRSALGQLLGMGAGLAAVLASRQPWSLAVTAVAGSLLSCALMGASLPQNRIRPRRPDRAAWEHVVYGAKASGMNLLRYSSGQFASWSISRFAGPPSLGGFNRATTLITIPLESLQRSFNYSLFPELRPGGPVFSSPRAFTDILILVAWPSTILATVGYFAAPPFITVLLGPGWDEAVDLAGLAALLGVLPMLSVPLGAAVEALGHFRNAILAWAAGTFSIALGIIGTAATANASVAMAGLLGAAAAGIAVNGVALARTRHLDTQRFARGAAAIGIAQVPVFLLLAAASSLVGHSPVTLLAISLVVGMLEFSVVWRLKERTPFGVLASQYGLPGFQTRQGGKS